jgi:hypothetical protein
VSATVRANKRELAQPPPVKAVKKSAKKKDVMYEVELFIDEKPNEYLVKWKGYPVSQATWEGKKQLKRDLKNVYQEFVDNYGLKKRVAAQKKRRG